MINLLDTDICIYYMGGRSAPVADRMLATPLSEMGLTAITIAELHFAAANSERPEQNLERLRQFLAPFQTFPFTGAAADHYGSIQRYLTVTGQPIGIMDTLTAATARAVGATIVTNNMKHFTRVPGLRVENWTIPSG